MNHLADDRSGADEAHLDDQIVESVWLHPRQDRHLRPALDPGRRRPYRSAGAGGTPGSFSGRGGDIKRDAVVRQDKPRGLFSRHHTQSEQINLDDAKLGAVFLVPLDDDAPRHGRRLQRNHFVQAARRR